MKPVVREKLDKMLDEHDIFTFSEEYYGQGICLNCGELRDSVEPDATDYECDDCGNFSVCGVEYALLFV